MRTSFRGPVALVALVLLAACTASPSESANPSTDSAPSASATPEADALELLIGLLEDPEMGFTSTFSGSSTAVDPDDPAAVPMGSSINGTLDAAGDDFQGTYEASGDIAFVAAQVYVEGQNYLSQGGGPFIEDVGVGRFPRVRESLLAILGATGAGAPELDGATLTVEPGSGDCSELLLALLLMDMAFDIAETAPCRIEADLTADGRIEAMTVEASSVGSTGDIALRLGWDLEYLFEDFGPPAAVAAPDDPWSTFAWDAGSLQIGHPTSWVSAGTDLNPILSTPDGVRAVAIIGGLVEGGPPTADQLVTIATNLMAEKYAATPESSAPVRGGSIDGTLLLSHATLPDGPHAYMVATFVHSSGTVYIVEFLAPSGQEAEDEAFFRTMLGTMLIGA
jgi:hypothetical protein